VVGELGGERVVEAVALGDLLDPDGVRRPVTAARDEVRRVARQDEAEEEEERQREEHRRDDEEQSPDDVARHGAGDLGSGYAAGKTVVAGPWPATTASVCVRVALRRPGEAHAFGVMRSQK